MFNFKFGWAHSCAQFYYDATMQNTKTFYDVQKICIIMKLWRQKYIIHSVYSSLCTRCVQGMHGPSYEFSFLS